MNYMEDDGSQNRRKLLNVRKKVIEKKKKNETGGLYWKEPVRTREIVDKSNCNSNGCHILNNTPMPYQQQNFEYATLAAGASLKYDCFMPTGEIYEFLPCAPWPSDQVLGYQKYRGMHRIMGMEGHPTPVHEAFVPYKLLLYRGRDNQNPGNDDRHRFVYLAENKPGEPAVGDCFVRLEEIHKRMKGTATDYIADCAVYNARNDVLRDLTSASKTEKKKVMERLQGLQRGGEWTLRFRCWAPEGNECAGREEKLRNRLLKNVYPANDKWDHFEVFAVWAELLRKSQGDKLAAKDFFGRYWDAVITDGWLHVFQDGFKIIVGAKYFQDRNLNYQNFADRLTVRLEVSEGVQRAVNAPRLKFKPPLTIDNIVFQDDLENQPQPIAFAAGWFEEGWRYLDGHPGGLYTILVNLPVRQFLCLNTHNKPFWEQGYGNPLQANAQRLQNHLDLCGLTAATTTVVNNTLINGVKNQKRNPTQDKCVANLGYSANIAMSDAYPEFYRTASIAKKRKVAEWLHRSAFSYGGYINGVANNSQVANNLVLGTPATNTVMMRYEAFVKRLAFHGIAFDGDVQHEDTVIVETKINYTELAGPLQAWVAQRQHTWLAPDLGYKYYNNSSSKPHVYVDGSFCPMNRETTLLFLSLLDRSLENLCWHWPCWDVNRAVVDALLESTGVNGDQEEADKEEVKEKLKEATDGDQEGPLHEDDLNLVVQQNLA